jgi:hypothetical protein
MTAERKVLLRWIGDPDSPGSLSARARSRRWEMFHAHFPNAEEMRVLDLGGTSRSWEKAPVHPNRLVVVNIEPDQSDAPWIHCVRGDACAPSEEILRTEFDLVFSNSLIEHVGGHYRRQQLAEVVHRTAEHYWVQTPYAYFPLEPHWLFPGFQFLPVRVKAAVSLRWRGGHMTLASKSYEQAVSDALSVELLSITDLRHYFPDAKIVRERFAGLVKSIVALR